MANTPTPEQLKLEVEQLNQRIDNLEARNAFQDDVIEQLNAELAVHQEQLSSLQFQFSTLAERFKTMQQPAVGKLEDEPPPPHY